VNIQTYSNNDVSKLQLTVNIVVSVEHNAFKRQLKTHLFKKHFNLYP